MAGETALIDALCGADRRLMDFPGASMKNIMLPLLVLALCLSRRVWTVRRAGESQLQLKQEKCNKFPDCSC